jgi:hypothetical protein
MRVLACTLAFVLSASSAYAVPEGEGGALSLSGGAVTGIATNAGGTIVAAASYELGGIHVWHEAAFSSPVEATGCTGAESVVFVPQTTLGDRFYVGCADGVVLRVEVDESTVPPTLAVDDSIVLHEGVGSVVELGFGESETHVHAIVQDGGLFSVHRFSISDSSDVDGLGLPLAGSGTVAAMTVGADSGGIIISDTVGAMSWVSRSGATYSAAGTPPVVVQGSTVDMVTNADATYSLWADGGSGDVWSLSHVSSSNAATRFLEGLPSMAGLGFVHDGSELRVWVALEDGSVEAYGLDDGLLDGSFSTATGYVDEFAAGDSGDDPVYGAGSDGTVRVFTDRPWLSGIAATPDSVQEGETFVVAFTADEGGTYDIRSAGPDPADGSSLATGSAVADEEVTVTLSVDDLDSEGENRLFVFVEDEAGDVGKDSVAVTRDTPPETVAGLAAEGGDHKLVVTWTSTEEPDIATYELYISDALFTASDSLPAFTVLVDEGEDDERTDEYPADVEWTGASETHSVTVEGLDNGTTYHLTVVSIDESGLSSSAAAVVTGIPVATCAASECADDTYGCTCAPNSIVASRVDPGALAVIALLAAVALPARRRR